MPLSSFHPVIQAWFRSKFQGPTEAQASGWPAIAKGHHTLISAPTGSGKTLAAFLTCIDALVRQGIDHGLPDATQIVYVSPLKALSNDIQKNLATPLKEIEALAAELDTPIPEIRTAVRTGDTKAQERRQMVKLRPHILITTPESLNILLTSRSGREGLVGVKTLILDEIHAVADDKRGAHLALSVERLCALAQEPVTRIGLSATQRPIEEVARFLVGNPNIGPDGTPDCTIVDTGRARSIDLDIQLPGSELGPIAAHELWGETLDTITGLVRSHSTTLVFVNTRRLVERVAHQLSQRLGEEAVVAHHGSLSRAIRLDAEGKLKRGEVKVCVATASLELGIDIGVVDLVCQIGSPRSISILLQRVGRSGHSLGGTPKGRLFPMTRDELLESTALVRAIRRGNLDRVEIPDWPLDVLAQQIVAACASEEWDKSALLDLCLKAYPYRDLPAEKFDQVVDVLSRGFAPREGRRGAFLHKDDVNGQLKGRRGARMMAITNGGAIPDNADYDVVVDPEGVFVGTVNEDFAIESMRGDVFLLGNTPWKITRVERGRVRVQDAQGQSPSVPFWLGEAPGRTRELSEEVSDLREGIDQLLDDPRKSEDWVTSEAGVSKEVAQQLVSYLAEGKRVLGVVPTGRRVVAERFFDESGGMQLVVHAPFGSKINRAWGMALRKRICRTFDFELQASSTDDGINLSLGPQLSLPVSDVFTYLSSRNLEEVLVQAILQAPIFATRWRWDATRSLAVLRFSGGKKVPAPLQRMRSDDLLAAVFPAQVACQDNANPGDVEPPDHPLVFETLRDCMTEAMDSKGLKSVLAAIERGEIEVYGRDTVQPSVFSHQILNAMPYAFLDDAPLEERRARAVSLRRALPEDVSDLGALGPEAIESESRIAWPVVRDKDELHDALLSLGVLPQEKAYLGDLGPGFYDLECWSAELVDAGRAYRLHSGGGRSFWVAAENLNLVRLAYPSAHLEPNGLEGVAQDSREDAILFIVRGWAECSGPFSSQEIAEKLDLPELGVKSAIGRLEVDGVLLRGKYRPGAASDEYCDRRILARIHKATINRLRKEIEPVSQSTFVRFLFRWQHVEPSSRLRGEGGVFDITEKLQGFEAPAAAWERDILLARVSDYVPSMLDRLCLGGEVVWGRPAWRQDNGTAPATRTALTRNTPITMALRDALDWLLDAKNGRETDLNGGPGDVLEFLSQRGASFPSDIEASTHRLRSDIEEALWVLAAAGRVTADNMETLRLRIRGNLNRGRRAYRARRGGANRRPGYGRWSLLGPFNPKSETGSPRALQLLRRYGVLCPELLAREPMSGRWRDLLQVLRRLEARGEIRGGRFVAGFVGEQFALPEAVQMLRSVKNSEPDSRPLTISACDPLNVVGILTPGDRVPAVLGNKVAFKNGVPVCSLEGGQVVARTGADEDALAEARSLIQLLPRRQVAGVGT